MAVVNGHKYSRSLNRLDNSRRSVVSFLTLLFLMAIANCLLFVNSAESADAAGKITAVEGVAEVLKEGAPPAIAVNVGDPVFVKDIVRTKSNSKVEITFTDGNILRLAQKSRMDISEYAAGTKSTIKLPRGKVQAIVQKDLTKRLSQDANRFEIHTPNAVAGVRGTDYFVYHDRNVTGVVVKEGSVHVINPAFPRVVVTVNAGNMTTVTPQAPPQPARPATESAIKGLTQDTTSDKPKDDKSNDDKPKDDKTAPSSSTAPGSTTSPEPITGGVKPIVEHIVHPDPPPFVPDIIILPPPPPPPPVTERITERIKDTEAPRIFIASQPSKYANSNAIFRLNTDEKATFSYKLDNNNWAPLPGAPRTSEDLAIIPMPEGVHTVSFRAVDPAGNATTTDDYKWLTANTQHNLGGGVTGDLSGFVVSTHDQAAKAETKAGIIAIPNIWITSAPNENGKLIGSWNIRSNGTYDNTKAMPRNLKLMTGGSGSHILKGPAFLDDKDALSLSGYWMSAITGKTSGGDNKGDINGTSNFTYLTDTLLVSGVGVVSGDYAGKDWKISDTSELGGYTTSRLAYGGKGDGGFMVDAALNSDPSAVAMDDNSSMSGRLGGTVSLWGGPQAVTLMGVYEDPNGHKVWSTDLTGNTLDAGALYGRMGGTALNNKIEGMAAAIYIRPDDAGGYKAGYIISSDSSGGMASFTGDQYAGLAADSGVLTSGMWSATGTMAAADMGATTITPDQLNENSLCNGKPCIEISTHQLKMRGDLKGVGDAESIRLAEQRWGVWSALLQSSEKLAAAPAANWNAVMGTVDSDESGEPNNYAIIKISGSDLADSKLKGTVDGRFLNRDVLGTVTGNTIGAFDDTTGTWQAFAVGITKEEPLSFVSSIGFASLSAPSAPSSEPPLDEGSFTAIIGGVDSLWGTGPAKVTMMGAYSPASRKPHLWATEIASNNYRADTAKFSTYDRGAYQGFIGGTERGGNSGLDKNMDANLYAIYVDPSGKAGILSGSLTGNLFHDLGPDKGTDLFSMDGTIDRIELSVPSSVTIPAPDNFISNIFRDNIPSTAGVDFNFNGTSMGGSTGPAFGFNYGFNVETLNIGSAAGPADWGIWRSAPSGSYTGLTVSDNWSWTIEHSDAGRVFGTLTTGTKWSDNKLKGVTVGYKADMAKGTTAIVVGETIGVFDPNTFTAIQMGAWMDTRKFLELVGEIGGNPNKDVLNALKIPAVEVGRVHFSGSGSVSGGSIDVTMKDAIIFAPTNGAKPTAWASIIDGTYFGNPNGASVSLSGNGLTVKFDVKVWDPVNKVWGSTVKGGGVYTGTGVINNTDLLIAGVASGKISSAPSGATPGTFSGTGSGWIKKK